jgi:hypothetical protein
MLSKSQIGTLKRPVSVRNPQIATFSVCQDFCQDFFWQSKTAYLQGF